MTAPGGREASPDIGTLKLPLARAKGIAEIAERIDNSPTLSKLAGLAEQSDLEVRLSTKWENEKLKSVEVQTVEPPRSGDVSLSFGDAKTLRGDRFVQDYLKQNPDLSSVIEGLDREGYKVSGKGTVRKGKLVGFNLQGSPKPPVPTFEEAIKDELKAQVPKAVRDTAHNVIDSKGISKEVMGQYMEILRQIPSGEFQRLMWRMRRPLEIYSKASELANAPTDFVWRLMISALAKSKEAPILEGIPNLSDFNVIAIRTGGTIAEVLMRTRPVRSAILAVGNPTAEKVNGVIDRILDDKAAEKPKHERTDRVYVGSGKPR